MIFFISTDDKFETPVIVETTDLNIGSEGASFQIDDAQLSGLNIEGNSFNLKAKKINPIPKNLPIITGENVSGVINITSKMLIKIKAKIAKLNTKENVLELHGNFIIQNENFEFSGSEIKIDLKNNSIISENSVNFIFPKGKMQGGKIYIVDTTDDKNFQFLMKDGVQIKYLL